jgi:hypothetical protein
MTVQEAIQARHSVRAYKEQPLADETVRVLVDKIAELNQEGRLHMQLILNEPKAFQGTLAKYGKFRNVNNYIVMAGKKAASQREESKTSLDSPDREQARTKFKADNQGYAIDRTDPDAKPRQVITDLTPWMYFRQVLARFDPDRQYAVTLRADSRKLADRVYKDARQRGILIPRDEDYGWRNPKSRTVTVRAYQWQQDYRIDWNKRCDADRIVRVEPLKMKNEE